MHTNVHVIGDLKIKQIFVSDVYLPFVGHTLAGRAEFSKGAVLFQSGNNSRYNNRRTCRQSPEASSLGASDREGPLQDKNFRSHPGGEKFRGATNSGLVVELLKVWL